MCDQAKEKKVACVYFYCYHGHNQDEALPFIRWLLSQLFRKANLIPDLAYKSFQDGQQPDLALLLTILEEISQHFDTIFVMVDALDESRPPENMLNLLQLIVTDDRLRKIQLFATSREYTEIQRTMLGIAKPLSLSNPLVESDIKRYVSARVASDATFRLWPNGLRVEVEEALSKGARGMFRWAVCQLDILRRLKDLRKIREAILNLPETLDETYERIFSYIPRYDRNIVRHALRWICFHNSLWQMDTPLVASALVDAYLMFVGGVQRDICHLVDLELLKDSCGCLITFAHDGDSGSERALLAHYTVREFLESDRVKDYSTFFRLPPDDPYTDILCAIFRQALVSQPYEGPEDKFALPPTNFKDYCIISSFRAIKTLEEHVDPSLAFQFLNPASSHYPVLQRCFEEDDLYYWQPEWRSLHTSDPTVPVFVQLMELGCYHLAALYLQEYGVKTILEAKFSIRFSERLSVWDDDDWGPWEFHGTVLEYFMVYTLTTKSSRHGDSTFCYEQGAGIVNFTSILSVYAGTHYNCACRDGGLCLLKALLHNGALPDPKGYQVTPLQIMCYLRDMGGARALLEAGADPNRIGNKDGIMWDSRSMLKVFEVVRGISPLRIMRKLPTGNLLDMNATGAEAVEQLLLQYGARDFEEQSEVIDGQVTNPGL